ncbi:MAG: hypothetical protein QG626_472 [Patescibacteria group bacterium]|jgi:hypothetical protein|nr:hypothetical protein [Patescibacteria group bacterium]
MFDKQDIAILKGMFSDVKIEMRDEIRAESLRLENKILHGVAEMFDISILPQVSELDHRVTNLERRVRLV